MITYIIIAISVVFVLLLCFALAIASFSTENYIENLKELNNSFNSFAISTQQYVEMINKKYFYNKIKTEKCEQYKDHYSRGKIVLSDETLSSNSLASLSVVSHELGHAKQDFDGKKLEKHWRLRNTGKLFGYFFSPLLIGGIALCLLFLFSIIKTDIVLYIGFALAGSAFLIFIFALILKYNEIKIEKDNSITINGERTKDFWDGRIPFKKRPLRLKIRNICGDESTFVIN